MPKTVACIIARTVSTRLPFKVLRHVDKQHEMLGYMVTRLKMTKKIDSIYICTSEEEVDDILEDIALKYDVNIYRGSADKVIERMIAVADLTKADNVIRITGDNVFTSYEYIDHQINILNEDQLDYIRLINVPIGATAEVMKVSALKHCYENIDPKVSEYLLLYMFDPNNYNCGVITVDKEDWSNYTLTVDVPEDLERTRTILSRYRSTTTLLKLSEIIALIQKHKIPNTIYAPSGDVKMPYGKVISFQEFKADMDDRISRSKQFSI